MHYGPVDIDTAESIGLRFRLRVIFNGEDVTNRCVFFDDVRNVVRLHRLKDGQPYLVGDHVAVEERTGELRVEVEGGVMCGRG